MAEIDPPSVKLRALLHGRVAWDDADPSIRSWARLTIYHAAKTIIAEPRRAARESMLGKIPESIRPHVRDEVVRLWPKK